MKVIMFLLICLLTIYAPLELSRLIIIYPAYSLAGEFIVELAWIWLAYITAMVLVWRYIRRVK